MSVHPIEVVFNRYMGGAAYVQKALGDLENELLATETDDQLSHRVHGILRTFNRLIEGPKVTIETAMPRYKVILDPDQ
jgi:hypothetical protein